MAELLLPPPSAPPLFSLFSGRFFLIAGLGFLLALPVALLALPADEAAVKGLFSNLAFLFLLLGTLREDEV